MTDWLSGSLAMKRTIVAMLLVALTAVAPAQDKSPGLTIAVVDASGYRLDDARAQSLGEVIAGLRAIRLPDAVGIEIGRGVTLDRVDVLIGAIAKSGLRMGNEPSSR